MTNRSPPGASRCRRNPMTALSGVSHAAASPGSGEAGPSTGSSGRGEPAQLALGGLAVGAAIGSGQAGQGPADGRQVDRGAFAQEVADVGVDGPRAAASVARPTGNQRVL